MATGGTNTFQLTDEEADDLVERGVVSPLATIDPVHVCKMETLYEAYRMAEENDGAPGIDGVTFEAIEEKVEWRVF